MVSMSAALLALAVTGAGETVLLDFSADWCGPCRQMEPTIRELAARGYPVRKVNVDHERQLAAQYGIGPIPCFVLLVNGREVSREVGAKDLASLEGMFAAAGIARPGSQRIEPRAQSPDTLREGIPFPSTGSAAPLRAVKGWAPPAGVEQDARRSPPASSSPSDQMLAASVRLKIDDGGSNSVGSGTIIDARQGEALVLTCGHLFRDSQGKGAVTIDLFGPGAPQGLPGRVVSYDLANDVGLVSFRPGVPVTAARVAPPSYSVRNGEQVVNIGCNHGQSPTARASRVTAIDKFVGPPNLVVAGQPVQGRSGGGLFTADGRVIGVCNAADPADNEGLYAALASIHSELDRVGLAKLCLEPGSDLDSPPGSLAVAPPSMPQRMPEADEMRSAATLLPTSAEGRGSRSAQADPPLSPAEAAALAEIRRRRGSAEVVCIIRPLDDPEGKTEIVVLDKVSPRFLEQLAAEK